MAPCTAAIAVVGLRLNRPNPVTVAVATELPSSFSRDGLTAAIAISVEIEPRSLSSRSRLTAASRRHLSCDRRSFLILYADYACKTDGGFLSCF
ncbi:hypothetical protein Acr_28g0013610 [Actinidia rufa]|uniref:Uncharacterized protein n=1 Tax=Actinidia rufa TaxID=165716 RepID=A0A7J0HC41_9ERIC|nr:hypothetical protein Acr_28g0013610 [Actinidia rufa]